MQNMTMPEFLSQHLQGEHSQALAAILIDIENAVKQIAIAIDAGAIAGNMGSLASENIQGEVQKTLDVLTNNIFIEWRDYSYLLSTFSFLHPLSVSNRIHSTSLHNIILFWIFFW